MVDVNTIVGDPVETPNGSVIMPVSRVACGFAAGGADYQLDGHRDGTGTLPFGGGSGGGVSVQPVGFLVVGQNEVRLLPVDGNPIAERLIDLTPTFLERLQVIMQQQKQEEKPGTIPPVG